MDDAISLFVKQSLADADDARPLYQKIANALTDAMDMKVAGADAALPSERSLASYLGVSRVTVRRALDDLAASGLLRRRHGARSSMGPRVEKTLSALRGFSEELRARGSEPGQRWLDKQIVLPTPNEAMALGIAPSEKIVRLVRVRLADGAPIAMERACVPTRFLPSPDLVDTSLYAALRKMNVSPARGAQRIRAGVTTRTEADALECDIGSPILIVERRCSLADGQIVEFTETRYHGERYDFMAELQVQ